MQRNMNNVPLGVGLSLFLVLSCAEFLPAQKVKTVDGVKIVTNGTKPQAPKGVPAKITFQEELSVGGGEDPETSFSEVGLFVVSDQGTIFGLDMKARNIKVYDAEGNFVRLIGRPGQGPGELGIPGGIVLTPDNELMVLDASNRSLSYFSLEGEHIRNRSIADKLGLILLVSDGKGNLAGREMGLEGSEMYFELKKFDRDLNPLFTVSKVKFKPPVPGSGNKINLMDMINMYAFDRKGNLYYGPNKDYEIQAFDAQGRHFLSIQREYKKVKITQDDIDEIMERMEAFGGAAGGINITELFEFPDYFPPYRNFVFDEDGRMFVTTWEKGEEKKDFWVDVYDQEGRYFTRFLTKIEISLWKKGKAYAIVENEDGFRVIKRYGANWSE